MPKKKKMVVNSKAKAACECYSTVEHAKVEERETKSSKSHAPRRKEEDAKERAKATTRKADEPLQDQARPASVRGGGGGKEGGGLGRLQALGWSLGDGCSTRPRHALSRPEIPE
uniref:Uncharacterized protein n=1 Tax=Oryza meridionalis TaxID=40149 RepID=A0A0E0D6Q0_9ORYZ